MTVAHEIVVWVEAGVHTLSQPLVPSVARGSLPLWIRIRDSRYQIRLGRQDSTAAWATSRKNKEEKYKKDDEETQEEGEEEDKKEEEKQE